MNDETCEHGTALDVHCCNCHSGFLFDMDSCVCEFDEEEKSMTKDQMFDEVKARFKHYAPANKQEVMVHEEIRFVCRTAAENLISALPEKVVNTREFSQVLTDLENAMMHANAAFARHKND